MLIFISVLPSGLKLFLLAKCSLNFLFNEGKKKRNLIAHDIFLWEVSKAHYFVLPSCYMLSVHGEVVLHHIRFQREIEL